MADSSIRLGQQDPNDQISEAIFIGQSGSTIHASLVDGGGANDVDLYTFNAVGDTHIGIDTDTFGDGNLDLLIRLFDSAGNELVVNDDGVGPAPGSGSLASYLEYTTPSGAGNETYYVGVSYFQNLNYNPINGLGDTNISAPDSLGAYAITVSNLGSDDNGRIGTADLLSLSGTNGTGGTIDPSVDVDMYRFFASAGTEVAAFAERRDGDIDLVLRVFDGAGNELASDTGSQTLGTSFVATTSGNYFAAISSSLNADYDPITGEGDTGLGSDSSATGSYALTLFGNSTLVNTTSDVVAADGFTSLREAVNFANSNLGQNFIRFDPIVFSTPQVINLNSQLTVTDDTRFFGPGADLLTINGQGNSRIFNFDDGINDSNQLIIIEDMRMTGGSSDQGGAIRNREDLRIRNVAIEGNTSTGAGGAIFTDGRLSVTSSTIADNHAVSGGAVHGGFRDDSKIFFFRSTVSGNTTTQTNRGAISTSFGDTYITETTVTDNMGGGVWGFENNSYTETRVVSSIISGNSDGDVNNNAAYVSTIRSDGFNLIGDGNSAYMFNQPGDIINTDPGLHPLSDNGGSTRTHALMGSSPAFNAGDPNFVDPVTDPSACIFCDQRGALRVVNGRVDIGSFERQAPDSLVVSSLSDVEDGDFSAGNLSLREAISLAMTEDDDMITFDDTLFSSPQTIFLTDQMPTIYRDVSIIGPGADLLTLEQKPGFRLFNVDDGDANTMANVTFSGLRMTGGDVSAVTGGEIDRSGGAILNFETLTVADQLANGEYSIFGWRDYESARWRAQYLWQYIIRKRGAVCGRSDS